MIGEVKQSNQAQDGKFEEFKTDPDLEGTTISLEEQN